MYLFSDFTVIKESEIFMTFVFISLFLKCYSCTFKTGFIQVSPENPRDWLKGEGGDNSTFIKVTGNKKIKG